MIDNPNAVSDDTSSRVLTFEEKHELEALGRICIARITADQWKRFKELTSLLEDPDNDKIESP